MEWKQRRVGVALRCILLVQSLRVEAAQRCYGQRYRSSVAAMGWIYKTIHCGFYLGPLMLVCCLELWTDQEAAAAMRVSGERI